jgi:[ribosomal protein S5]-alanine N-acetyltransferase
MRQLVSEGKVSGLVAYAGTECVGWLSVDPIEVLVGHDRFDANRPDEWSIHCVFLKDGHRGHGYSEQMIKAAIGLARSQGAKKISAFPIPSDNRSKFPADSAEFSGRYSTFLKLGFVPGKYNDEFYQRVELDFSKHGSVPTFHTARLILRPLQSTDAERYEKYFADYEIIGQLAARVPWPYPKGGVLHYFLSEVFPEQGDDYWMWGIFLKETPNEVIGGLNLWRPGTPENRGFWLAKPFWGKGLMTEAVAPVMDFAFNELGFEKLVFSNALGNVRSRRVKERTGARLTGTRPGKFVNPAYTEAETWELDKTEWEQFRLRP